MKSPYLRDAVVESPVGLVLVEAGNRANAMTVSFFSELAHHPTSLWVSIAKTTYTHALIEETRSFSLVVLNSRQRGIAIACGSVSGRDRDKCAALDLYRSPSGFLFLHRALASTACRVRDLLCVGGHTVFLADILEGEVDSRRGHLRHLLLSDL